MTSDRRRAVYTRQRNLPDSADLFRLTPAQRRRYLKKRRAGK